MNRVYLTYNESPFYHSVSHSDLMLKDMETGDTLKIAENSYASSLSADGSEIAFLSHSPNLVASDNRAEQDIFVARLASGDDRVLHGTKKADMLEGGVGNDMIHGQNGDDVLRSYRAQPQQSCHEGPFDQIEGWMLGNMATCKNCELCTEANRLT